MRDTKYRYGEFYGADPEYVESPWKERSDFELEMAKKVIWSEFLYDFVHFNRTIRFLSCVTRAFSGDLVSAVLLVLIIDWSTRIEPGSKEWINFRDRFFLPDCYTSVDDEGWFDISFENIARLSGINELDVRQGLANLSRMGFIKGTNISMPYLETMQIRLVREKLLKLYYIDFDLSTLLSPDHQDEPDDHHEFDSVP